MLAYFVVVFGLIGFGVYKVLSQNGGNELPLGFDDRPKPGMRVLNKLKEWIRKITRDKVKCTLVSIIFSIIGHFFNPPILIFRSFAFKEWEVTVCFD